MPTYEYACKKCGHTFEAWQSMSDDPLTICPKCGGELRKVFTAPAISFRGSGFYATDHGKKSKKASEESGSTNTASETTSGDKTDTKGKKETKESSKPVEKKSSSGGGDSGSGGDSRSGGESKSGGKPST